MKPEEMTQEAAIDLLKKGKDAWHAWLAENGLAIADDVFKVFERLADATYERDEGAMELMAEIQQVFKGDASSLDLRAELRFFIEADLSGLELQGLDLCGFVLNSANLSGANLSGAKLIGTKLDEVDLRGANLSGADLTLAELIGANLCRANISGADLRLAEVEDIKFLENAEEITQAVITEVLKKGGKAWEKWLMTNGLLSSDLNFMNFVRFSLPSFKGVDLSGFDLRFCDLRYFNFENANLSGALLYDANLSRGFFKDANLSGADLRKTTIDRASFFRCDLRNVILSEKDIRETKIALIGADLSGAELSGVNLSSVDLSWTNFIEANLTGAQLHNANLHEADFREANLTGAQLYNANLDGADFRTANLRGANIISKAKEATQAVAIAAIKKGKEAWNKWLEEQELLPHDLDLIRVGRRAFVFLEDADLSKLDLQGFDFRGFNLNRVDFTGSNLSGADFSGADLSEAKLNEVNLKGGMLTGATLYKVEFRRVERHLLGPSMEGHVDLSSVDFTGAIIRDTEFSYVKLSKANLQGVDLSGRDFTKADLSNTNFVEANLSNANLRFARLSKALLSNANLSQADLTHADLTGAILLNTNLDGSRFDSCKVYGISVWDPEGEPASQNDLVITDQRESEDNPIVTVDDIEVAQFIYMMLNNDKIRKVLSTITGKGVLILGRFTPERKKILDAIRNQLRELNYVPMMFDFEKVESRDFTETILTLAGMSRFVIADITNPSSSPLELQATVPNFKIPLVPIIQKEERAFAMFSDLKGKFNWVLQELAYESEVDLLKAFQKGIIDRAIAKEEELLKKDIPGSPLDTSDYH